MELGRFPVTSPGGIVGLAAAWLLTSYVTFLSLIPVVSRYVASRVGKPLELSLIAMVSRYIPSANVASVVVVSHSLHVALNL